jgi:hypothetical protein
VSSLQWLSCNYDQCIDNPHSLYPHCVCAHCQASLQCFLTLFLGSTLWLILADGIKQKRWCAGPESRPQEPLNVLLFLLYCFLYHENSMPELAQWCQDVTHGAEPSPFSLGKPRLALPMTWGFQLRLAQLSGQAHCTSSFSPAGMWGIGVYWFSFWGFMVIYYTMKAAWYLIPWGLSLWRIMRAGIHRICRTWVVQKTHRAFWVVCHNCGFISVGVRVCLSIVGLSDKLCGCRGFPRW